MLVDKRKAVWKHGSLEEVSVCVCMCVSARHYNTTRMPCLCVCAPLCSCAHVCRTQAMLDRRPLPVWQAGFAVASWLCCGKLGSDSLWQACSHGLCAGAFRACWLCSGYVLSSGCICSTVCVGVPCCSACAQVPSELVERFFANGPFAGPSASQDHTQGTSKL